MRRSEFAKNLRPEGTFRDARPDAPVLAASNHKGLAWLMLVILVLGMLVLLIPDNSDDDSDETTIEQSEIIRF